MSDSLHKLHEEEALRVDSFRSAPFNHSRFNDLTSPKGFHPWLRKVPGFCGIGENLRTPSPLALSHSMGEGNDHGLAELVPPTLCVRRISLRGFFGSA